MKSRVTCNEFRAPGLYADKGKAQGGRERNTLSRSLRLLLVSMLSVVLLCSALLVTEAADQSITYERAYPKGYSTNDDDPDNIITVDPQIRGERSSFELEYFTVNHTLIIEEENIRNITLFYDRAILEVGSGEFSYYGSLLLDPLYIQVKSHSNLRKNITINNVPRMPNKIYRNGVEVDFTRDGNVLSIHNFTSSNFTVRFIDTEEGGITDLLEGEEFLGIDTTTWLYVVLGVLIFIVCVIFFIKVLS